MDYLDDMDPTGECEYEIFNNSLKKKQLLLTKQEMYVVQQYFALCDSSVCSIHESNLYNYNINILIL